MKLLTFVSLLFVGLTTTPVYATCGNFHIPENKFIEVEAEDNKSLKKNIDKVTNLATKDGWTLVSTVKVENAKHQYLLGFTRCVPKPLTPEDLIVE